MEDRKFIILLQDQLRLACEREKTHLEQNKKQAEQIDRLILKVEELTQTIQSLEDALTLRNESIDKLSAKNRGLSKILSNPSEKLTPAKQENKSQAPSPKQRGNNNAKRKDHYTIEQQVVDVYPDDPAFDLSKARFLGTVESIRYKYTGPRFVRCIFKQHNYVCQGTIMRGKAPAAPLLNSRFDSSFYAGMMQLRYIYSLPIERIVKMFNEHGFDLNKSTAHGLIQKAAQLLEPMDNVLRSAIHTDPYLVMDETYHQVLVEEKNEKGKGTRKGYIWGVIAGSRKLAHFIYENGSRSKDVFNRYLDKSYRGAVHTDGLVCYKELETRQYPHAIRIGCWQHCKRKFLDMDDPDARLMVNLINQLYQIEHRMESSWNTSRKLKHRQKEGGKIIRKIEQHLSRIQGDPQVIPKSPLSDALNYLQKELPALKNYLIDYQYALDTNTIERYNRYISLSRRNSLFCGSHDGAKRMALLYSLACSCRLNGINTLDYFSDVLNQLATIPPNAKPEIFRQLLPDMWRK